MTLAHRGVLFLDEMPEFARGSLEVLRQPLEDKQIQLSRASGTYVFPAGFILVAAMNPCPCGYYPDMNKCRCTPGEVSYYLHKLSQPLLERIDLCADVPPVNFPRSQKKNQEKVLPLSGKEWKKPEKYSRNATRMRKSVLTVNCPEADPKILCADRECPSGGKKCF